MQTDNTKGVAQLADYVRRARANKGMSLRALAEKSGVGFTTLHRLEAATVENPRPAVLQAVARALQIDAEELYAQLGLLSAHGLPEFRTYLRSKYPGMPAADLDRLDGYFHAVRDNANQD